ncbi:integrase core domain-containing protein [Streptomyces sp. W16]|uniref:integrase core domain-containing protein n=1 Tax=Streptomyces sp. W16 TaxID=3076631 RepID=UPI003FA3C61C
METQIGLYKTELIKPRKPWHGLADVELATAEWVDWSNNQRLHTAIGDIPPHEHETNYHAQHREGSGCPAPCRAREISDPVGVRQGLQEVPRPWELAPAVEQEECGPSEAELNGCHRANVTYARTPHGLR